MIEPSGLSQMNKEAATKLGESEHGSMREKVKIERSPNDQHDKRLRIVVGDLTPEEWIQMKSDFWGIVLPKLSDFKGEDSPQQWEGKPLTKMYWIITPEGNDVGVHILNPELERDPIAVAAFLILEKDSAEYFPGRYIGLTADQRMDNIDDFSAQLLAKMNELNQD